jgi:ABC-type branched-subunit amino acid transport system ATPase component
MTTLLTVDNLHAYYGHIQALHGVAFSLNEGSVTTLLGANGAGKTTTLRAICGMVRTTGRSNSTASRFSHARRRASSSSASPMCRRGAAPSPR